MGKDKKLGKIVADVSGYKVRIMLASKTSEKLGREGKAIKSSFMGDTGKFGVYAGKKKLIKGDFTSKNEASEFALSIKTKK